LDVLCLQGFKTIIVYKCVVYRITSQLELCGEKVIDEDMLAKIISAFHASDVFLQQQYQENVSKKYSNLISCLLLVEQNNELLVTNREARPIGIAQLP